MPPFLEIVAYAPCNSHELAQQHVNTLARVLQGIGITGPELDDWLAKNATALANGEFWNYETWYGVDIGDYQLRARPHLMSWTPETISGLGEIWLQTGLYFELHEVLGTYGFEESGDRFPPRSGQALWSLMRHFAQDFGSAGVYLIVETSVYPWEVLNEIDGDVWQFHLALVPHDMQQHFNNPPSNILVERLDYGIGMLNKGIDRWPIHWPEIPWQENVT